MYLLLVAHWFALQEPNIKSPMSKDEKVFTFQMLKEERVLTVTTIQINCVCLDNVWFSEIILTLEE